MSLPRKPKTESKVEIVRVVLSGGAVLISMLAGVSTIFCDTRFDPKPTKQGESLQRTEAEINRFREEIAEIKSQIGKLSEIPEESRVASRLVNLNQSISQLESRFSKIEKIIIKDPSESLEIPLIRNDIENIKEVNQSQIETMKQDIERAYTIILGTLI
jgi:predicted nuclease with TOPRIM domain